MSDTLTLGRDLEGLGEEAIAAVPLHAESLGDYGPLGFEAGDANLYRYVGNDPTDETDPTGLQGGSAPYPSLPPVPGSGFPYPIYNPNPTPSAPLAPPPIGTGTAIGGPLIIGGQGFDRRLM